MMFNCRAVFVVVTSFLLFAECSVLKRGHHHPVRPKVAGRRHLANVTDPAVSRDSCGSARIGDRALWTCRDTEVWDRSTEQAELPLITNTASWTDFDADGSPKLQHGPVGDASSGHNQILRMYGGHPTDTPSFYPVLSDECPDNGVCSDGTRWAIWPNSPVMITESGKDGSAKGYTWIPKAHLNGLTALIAEPARTLYKVSYTPKSNKQALPAVSVVDEEFWAEGEIGYGDYGNVVKDGVAYLYGQTDAKGTALAKVPVDSVEDKSKYRYYVGGSWTSAMPGINDTAAVISNAGAGGQGTFYYSAYFSSYIWIGQAALSGSADFMITTAPSPEGPWIEPYQFFTGGDGDSSIAGGYTLQAHPALQKSPDESGIHITWTKQYESTTYGGYITPLWYIKWK